MIITNYDTLSFQEYRSEKSLEALTKLVPPKCHWYVQTRISIYLFIYFALISPLLWAYAGSRSTLPAFLDKFNTGNMQFLSK